MSRRVHDPPYSRRCAVEFDDLAIFELAIYMDPRQESGGERVSPQRQTKARPKRHGATNVVVMMVRQHDGSRREPSRDGRFMKPHHPIDLPLVSRSRLNEERLAGTDE
jgi:hypothetical protein